MADIFSGLGPVIQAFYGYFIGLLFLLAIIGGLGFLYWSGIFENWNIRVIVLADRGRFDNSPKDDKDKDESKKGFRTINKKAVRIVKGKFIKGGKFLINYGLSDKVSMSAMAEEFVYDDTVFVWRRARDDHIPLKMRMDAEGNLDLDPSLSPEAKLSLDAADVEARLRFTKPNPLQQYAIPFAVIVSAIIVGLAFIFGAAPLAKAYSDATPAWQAIAAKISNATILVEQPSYNSTSSTGYINNNLVPVPTHPPGG